MIRILCVRQHPQSTEDTSAEDPVSSAYDLEQDLGTPLLTGDSVDDVGSKVRTLNRCNRRERGARGEGV